MDPDGGPNNHLFHNINNKDSHRGKILKSEAPGSEKRNLPCKVENTRLFWRKRRRMLSLLNGTQIRPFLMRNENYYPYKFFVRPYLTLSKSSLKYCHAQRTIFFRRRGQCTAPSGVKRPVYLLRLPCAEEPNSGPVLHETFVSFSWNEETQTKIDMLMLATNTNQPRSISVIYPY